MILIVLSSSFIVGSGVILDIEVDKLSDEFCTEEVVEVRPFMNDVMRPKTSGASCSCYCSIRWYHILG
jgi:hypothetical protein